MTLEAAYKILGVSSEASLDEVIEAYREKANKYQTRLNLFPYTIEKIQLIYEAFYLIKEDLSRYETTNLITSNTKEQDIYYSDLEQPNKKSFKEKLEETFYKVVLPVNSAIFIPKFCPVCMSRNSNEISKTISFLKEEFISLKKSKLVEKHIDLSFHCCCENSFNKYVKLYNNSNRVFFYFKNKDYAEFFAYLNSAYCKEITKKRQMAEKIAHVANVIYNFPGINSLFVIGFSTLIILIIGSIIDFIF